MHGQNRFWRVLSAVFGEKMTYTNRGFLTTQADKQERADLAVWSMKKLIEAYSVLRKGL